MHGEHVEIFRHALLAGHSDPRWLTAVVEQAGELAHTSNLFHTAPQVVSSSTLWGLGCVGQAVTWHTLPVPQSACDLR